MNALLDRFAGPAREALPRLTPAERAVVHRELAELEHGGHGDGPLLDGLRKLAAQVPERLYTDSADVLLRMHEIAGSGNLQSNLSSLPLVRACFALGLAEDDGRGGPADLIVGRGHIAPAFHAEHYVRGNWPFTPLATLHQGGLSGVVHRDLGFRNTMRYSLGVGVAQAVSLAWELTRRGEDRKVVCLAGDGELHEGVAFEALRFAHDAGLTNLVLVVDANAKGIEPLAKPVNTGYLTAYLGRLVEADGRDPWAVEAALGVLLTVPGPGVLVCRTRKGDHSFKPAPAPGAATAPAKPSFAGTTGRMLAAHQERTGRETAVFTADMAARFGLRGHVPYTNTGLAETLTVGMTLSLPDDTLKVVATDAMYYMDSLSMLTEATTGVRNLLVLAGRSWGAWGGAHNAANLLGLLLHTRVYEPVTEAEFAACLDRLARDPATTHAVSMVDARFDPPPADCAADIDGGAWITPPDGDAPCTAAVVTFGYASVLVAEANRDLGLPHLHCAALTPELDPATLAVLSDCRRVLSVEYNGADGGFGERLRARHLLPVEVHAVRRDIAHRVHARQLPLHGMSVPMLRDRLAGLLETREAGRAPAHA
ncbi:1-deoxy-D-xylulose-5-phosphate synthase N-terminal domain-containing protein [Streptomyces sp. CC210A]|uniref:1-deoxy-D-xylulose-5-phosphate synthase N-terminal domain-containing protein n=1 Tax=Streptomyces sp. CC210A TaxID=2898184 RepID=UPI001F29749C|nr:1-deoxy-D-xylulose-5-phosphate synthase N-terminal domain-containing protein [Streptomyces sp. CC210A]